MCSSPAESDEYAEYFSGSGAIPCRVLYRTEQLAFVVFRTAEWPGYRDFSNFVRVALYPEHLRPADPQSPGVMNWVQAIAREIAAEQQHLLNRAANPTPKQEKGRGASAPKTCAKVTPGNGAKPTPAKPPARGRRARTSGEDGHPLRPVRSIAGLTIGDFLYDR